VFCALFVVLSLSPVFAISEMIIVPDDYATIQGAINHSQPNDTIFVKSGIYTENVVLNKDNLRLIGEAKETTVIDGNRTGIVVAK
jgi:pectin methylesterase-like acyl-CoA thioesterase